MSLYDRIMAMDPADSGVLPESHNGYAYAQIEAAQLAKEADELMAEMAAELEWYCDNEKTATIWAKYKAYKENTNDR